MTHQDKLDLAARLVIHADHIERIGNQHSLYRYSALILDLQDAAAELRRDSETPK